MVNPSVFKVLMNTNDKNHPYFFPHMSLLNNIMKEYDTTINTFLFID